VTALYYANRVQETSSTTGTGTLTLAGAVSGYQSFLTAFGSTAIVQVYYTIWDSSTNWETGRGTYTGSATTLSRDIILSSSNSGSAVNFTAATINVWLDFPSQAVADIAMTTAIAMKMVPQ
jgi:hypothetical protein